MIFSAFDMQPGGIHRGPPFTAFTHPNRVEARRHGAMARGWLKKGACEKAMIWI